MRRLIVLAAVLATLVVAGCSQTSGTPVATGETTVADEMPDDFVASIVYRNGSVPPPYHYEWSLRVDTAGAELSWRPGYDEDEQPWVETVPVTREQRAALYERLRDAGAFEAAPAEDEGLVGGPTGAVELVADGRTHDPGELGLNHDSQDILDEIHTAAKDVVPAAVWTRMSDQQDTWGEQHPN